MWRAAAWQGVELVRFAMVPASGSYGRGRRWTSKTNNCMGHMWMYLGLTMGPMGLEFRNQLRVFNFLFLFLTNDRFRLISRRWIRIHAVMKKLTHFHHCGKKPLAIAFSFIFTIIDSFTESHRSKLHKIYVTFVLTSERKIEKLPLGQKYFF